MRLDGRQILYASTNHAWTEGWTFYQMLAVALARRNDVVYLDRPTSIARGGVRRPRAHEEDGLRVLRTPTLPLQRTNRLRWTAATLTSGLVGRWARRARFAPDLLWVYTPYELELARRFPTAFLAYWTGDEVVIPAEEALLARADVLLCVSQPVYERHRTRFGERAHFVPVACDFERYHRAVAEPPDAATAALQRPVLGYSGFLNERIDAGTLGLVADAFPYGSVVVAGPISIAPEAEADLRRRPNVHLLGPQPAERVPAIINAFDVGLAPYRDTEFNRNANPVKFYEYLALGKPVVVTDIPTLRPFAHAASIGALESFVERTREEVRHPTGTREERVDVARAHSFAALLARLEELPA